MASLTPSVVDISFITSATLMQILSVYKKPILLLRKHLFGPNHGVAQLFGPTMLVFFLLLVINSALSVSIMHNVFYAGT